MNPEIMDCGKNVEKMLISIPSFSGQIPKYTMELVQRWKDTTIYTKDRKGVIQIDVHIPSRMQVYHARNNSVKKFLNEGYDYFLFLDSDNPINKHGLQQLIDDDKDVVCAAIPSRKIDVTGRNIVAIVDRVKEKGYVKHKPYYSMPSALEPFKVDSAGTGCVLYKREPIETAFLDSFGHLFEFDVRRYLKTKVPAEIDADEWMWTEVISFAAKDHIVTEGEDGSKKLYEIDLSVIDPNLKMVHPIGEDINAHDRMSKLGYEMRCDPRVQAIHDNDENGRVKLDHYNFDGEYLTICVPIYKFHNKVREMFDAIKKVREESPFKIRLVVGYDRGQGELSQEFKNEISKKYDINLLYIPEKNIGVNKQRSKLVENSFSRFTMVLNDDCIINTNTVLEMCKILEKDLDCGCVGPKTKTPDRDSIYKVNNIIGRCYMMPTIYIKKVFPLPEELDIWFGDDYIFHMLGQLGLSVKLSIKGEVFHYESVTVDNENNKMMQRIKKDQNVRKEILIKNKWSDQRFNVVNGVPLVDKK